MVYNPTVIERPLLGISQERVINANHEANLEGDLNEYIDFQLDIIDSEQPELYAFLAFAEDRLRIRDQFSYSMGVVLSYRMIPDQHRNVVLSTDQLQVVLSTIRESIQSEDGERGTLGISWFTEKMSKDSQPYAEWLDRVKTDMGDEQAVNDFVLGSFLVVAPFYMRAEAKRLEEQFE